jgi:hypothetical protein
MPPDTDRMAGMGMGTTNGLSSLPSRLCAVPVNRTDLGAAVDTCGMEPSDAVPTLCSGDRASCSAAARALTSCCDLAVEGGGTAMRADGDVSDVGLTDDVVCCSRARALGGSLSTCWSTYRDSRDGLSSRLDCRSRGTRDNRTKRCHGVVTTEAENETVCW